MMLKTILCGVVALLPTATVGFIVPTASGSSVFARGSSKVAHVSGVAPEASTSRPTTTATMGMERSYIMIKPDGVQRG